MAAESAPFISDWASVEAYAKLKSGTPGSVHNFEEMAAGFGGSGFEAAVGVENVVDAGLLAILADRRRAVARITCSGVNFRGERGDWTGTGFLVGPNLLVTNNHVLHDVTSAGLARVEFEYERTPEQMLGAGGTVTVPRRLLPLDPARLFLTSAAVGGLDYSFIWIGDEAAREYGYIPMSRGSFVLRHHEPVFLIHHPNGRPKQASLDDTELLNVDGDLLLYAADTDRGSSGAPVIAQTGKLCGLHHAFRRDRGLVEKHEKRAKRLQDGSAYEIANEGIKFSAIAVHLEHRLARPGPDRAAIETVLSHFVDFDSITGPFGVRGRTEPIPRPPAPQEVRAVPAAVVAEPDGNEAVLQAYKATDQDIDVAIWNMGWLESQAKDRATMRRAATVLADITQDVWVLDGLSRETAKRLRDTLHDGFGQRLDCAFAEDDTHPGQPLTTLFHNPRSVSVRREAWPPRIERLWRITAQKDLELKRLEGPIFPSFPARFIIGVPERDPAFTVTLLPIFIGATGDAAVRRYAAARLMTLVSAEMLKDVPLDQDWLIVGDVNTPLRRTRIEEIAETGFRPLLAIDQTWGGFSYLRGEDSQLAQLFVPQGTETVGDDDGMVTQIDRNFSGRFVDALTGASPHGVRLSLHSMAATREMRGFDRRLEAKVETMLGTTAFDSASGEWLWRGLDKPAFLSANAGRIRALLAEVNAWSADRHGDGALLLTELDLIVMIYCEAGFQKGVMDAEANHSLGERGLLPLPSNLGFWIGSTAPSHDTLLSLRENIGLYARYLAAIVNKPVRTSPVGMLYSALFRATGIAGHPARSAKVLAGVIHGYFLDLNYRGGATADPAALLAGYRADLGVHALLASSGYVHAGTGILANRQRNIDAALRDFLEGL
ncbi:serine protease [Sulfitobacter sp. AS92]|uniref:trypsin-like serine peptidase n=1 Tax=Sulfitobacter sp. AS92 TaxID=3135783 RepID=UPI00317EE54F